MKRKNIFVSNNYTQIAGDYCDHNPLECSGLTKQFTSVLGLSARLRYLHNIYTIYNQQVCFLTPAKLNIRIVDQVCLEQQQQPPLNPRTHIFCSASSSAAPPPASASLTSSHNYRQNFGAVN